MLRIEVSCCVIWRKWKVNVYVCEFPVEYLQASWTGFHNGLIVFLIVKPVLRKRLFMHVSCISWHQLLKHACALMVIAAFYIFCVCMACLWASVEYRWLLACKFDYVPHWSCINDNTKNSGTTNLSWNKTSQKKHLISQKHTEYHKR